MSEHARDEADRRPGGPRSANKRAILMQNRNLQAYRARSRRPPAFCVELMPRQARPPFPRAHRRQEGLQLAIHSYTE